MGPISVIIANFLLDNWVREEVVNLVDCSVVAYGYLVFMVGGWEYFWFYAFLNAIRM